MHLVVRLLGPFQVELGREPVTAFDSDKVRALLAYLVTESDRPHRRESLAGLLWPHFKETSARSNLRSALASLRQAIGDREANPPLLQISRHTLQFSGASDAWVDVRAFSEDLAAAIKPGQDVPQWENGVSLYRGSFLEGFSIADSPEFEEWALMKRERFHRMVTQRLRQLAAYREGRNEYEAALTHARRVLELDPLLETAHRQVMRLLACMGERGAALSQFENCRRVLRIELDVAPSHETEQLYQQIRQGEWKVHLSRAAAVAAQPSFLNEDAPAEVEKPLFVARAQELSWLQEQLARSLAHHGGVAFVIGGPGRGKTALLAEFARRAMQAQPGLLVASGAGNAYSGVGDPYLPFRSVLEMLSGDVAAQWTAGRIDREHALRLWRGMPATAEALAEHGPDLVDTFLSGQGLAKRMAVWQAEEPARPAWLAKLQELVNRKASLPPDPNLQQSALFRQYARVLADLARQHPLLLLLDDLQWLDTGSAGLLFHLGRELSTNRILIIGAYRPEEILAGRPGTDSQRQERHPLDALLGEFKRRYGDIWLDLGQTSADEGHRFVEALVDSEPNRLGFGFRASLYRRTEGHPLFTIELLRALRERGDLAREGGQEGVWVARPDLDWGELPPKVEGVIAERIKRLDPSLRELLTVASVEGETFTAEAVARVVGTGEREVVRRLSAVLERQHRLVRTLGLRRLDGTSLSLYRFQHNLIQKYLYDTATVAERAYLHQDVGSALEALYADHPRELEAVAPQLARHFQEAGDTTKAVQYLGQAGQRATQLSAHSEALAHFAGALQLLEKLPDTTERARTELGLQLGIAVALVPIQGWGTPEMARVITRAQALCERTGDAHQRFGTLFLASNYHNMKGDYPRAAELVWQYNDLAERSKDEGLLVAAYYGATSISFFTGEFTAAVAFGERVRDLYDPGRHHVLTYFTVGHDPGAQAREAAGQSLWMLGYPDQARQFLSEAVALAEKLAHPYTVALAYLTDAVVASLCHDWSKARERAEKAMAISQEHDYPITDALARCEWGLALTKYGGVEKGIAEIQQGIADWQATDSLGLKSELLIRLAEVCLVGGQTQLGLDAVDEALDFVAQSQETFWEAELHRLKGELLLRDELASEKVEREYWRAIKVARQQRARSWELRATMSLAQLWASQGQRNEAREVLEEVYAWFTEGFDTGDLIEASAFLAHLSGAAPAPASQTECHVSNRPD